MNITCKVVKNELSVDMHVSRYAKIVEELRIEVMQDLTVILVLRKLIYYQHCTAITFGSNYCSKQTNKIAAVTISSLVLI